MPLGQSYDLLARDLIAIVCRLVTEGARAHADNPQGSSLTQSASGHVGAPVRGVTVHLPLFPQGLAGDFIFQHRFGNELLQAGILGLQLL